MRRILVSAAFLAVAATGCSSTVGKSYIPVDSPLRQAQADESTPSVEKPAVKPGGKK